MQIFFVKDASDPCLLDASWLLESTITIATMTRPISTMHDVGSRKVLHFDASSRVCLAMVGWEVLLLFGGGG
jgi:hypothetical protein